MPLNYKEIDLILTELKLENSIIREFFQSSFKTFFIALRKDQQNINIKITLDSNKSRISRVEYKLKKLESPQRFMQFINSNIINSKIIKTDQPSGERIIKLVLTKGNAVFHFYIKLWTSAFNLILCDEKDEILDALSRKPKEGEIKGRIFVIPTSVKKNDYKINENVGKPFCEKIEEYYSKIDEEEEKTKLTNYLRNFYEKREKKLKERLKDLEVLENDREKILKYREDAEALKNLIYKYKDSFPNEVPLENETFRKVKMNMSKSFIENVNDAFKKAKKMEIILNRVEEDRERINASLNNIVQTVKILQETQKLDFLKKEVEKIKNLSKEKNKEGKTGLHFISCGMEILVGRSSEENEKILRQRVRGLDLWMHVRDMAGAYVFIKSIRGKSFPLETLLDAANLAIFYSKAKKEMQGEVRYTEVKHLKKIKGDKKGLVVPQNEKNMFVKLDLSRIERLQNSF